MSYNTEAFKLAQAQAQAQMRASSGPLPYYYSPQVTAQAAANLLAMRQAQPPQPRDSTPVDDSSQDGRNVTDQKGGKKTTGSLKGLFTKDLKEIMYGLGDEAPAPDTVALMDDILVEYLHELITTAGQAGGKNIQTDDLRRSLQGPGDERKLARLEELVRLQIEIKKARAIHGLAEAGGRNLAD
ncbi:hypothetical protein FRC14_005833 [Serendipita sp. 396]|nr:hypothetical protein FRC14_005833 [Serendipita sp. 396]KAG8776727.1 hypothetical protein FRC15_011794 [Serendipita sp. 397]KAG8799119.1 hypothetical protein FRC16_005754 [Serendipita sp. 398]KAG8825369.1 hypothetical protein FRC19_011606 [Serendipita sp. 401]KAG8838177.1 hypothetical protein FRC18_005941 [Serendipita sp. 400]KAG8849466.1 hypothetical protein FRB91_009865 [Serendipita sp. 411]KAG8863604.1 hypothetical protein FRC20_010699 [Serendipita sp. 405]KAG9055012.1 hypothetical prot